MDFTERVSVRKKWLVQYAVISLLSLFLIPLLKISETRVSGLFLAGVETGSGVVALISGLAICLFFYYKGNIFYYIMGVGFLLIGSEEFFAGFFIPFMPEDSASAALLFLTYQRLSRVIFAFSLIGGILKEQIIFSSKHKKRLLIIVPFIFLIAFLSVFWNPLKGGIQIIFTESQYRIWYYIIMGLLYFLSFYLGFRRLLFTGEIFTRYILLSLLCIFYSHIFMIFSRGDYDLFYTVNCYIRLLSHSLPLAGLFIYVLDQTKKLKNTTVTLKLVKRKQIKEREQFMAVFNSIDQFIYVVDPQSCEILFVNEVMKKSFGKELIGGICYKDLYGMDSSCGVCSAYSSAANGRDVQKYETYNQLLKQHFSVTDRIILWPDGRKVHLKLALNITEKRKADAEIQKVLTETLRVNYLMEKREMRIIGIKKEVNSLLQELGREIKYRSVE